MTLTVNQAPLSSFQTQGKCQISDGTTESELKRN
jgi:hypothetical protein